MRRRINKFNKYRYPPWLRQTRAVCVQFIIPITVVQGVRTILIPTSFDVLFLAVLILLAAALHLDWI
ncbi:hypothetical protein [Fredinandcohnia quinoae]|uniref:Uncharacterized protein n=1 Tax=Fredinandcohnia quinoae TaxID=2918902 RepID=A0AAW5E2K3_9BACI|nr:hypothetical protein [Fredinandcohnia sp. SECRCQ15]MCH1626593.1 hypothetical protein [Fredinandcohnia sp. SECRCQ15]